jgi:hypothetical protein
VGDRRDLAHRQQQRVVAREELRERGAKRLALLVRGQSSRGGSRSVRAVKSISTVAGRRARDELAQALAAAGGRAAVITGISSQR